MSSPDLSKHTAAEIVDALFGVPADLLQEVSFLMTLRNQEALRRAQVAFHEQMEREANIEAQKKHIRSRVDKIIREVDDGSVAE